MAGLGDSFVLPKPGQEIDHLWVLITQPNPQSHEAIMVNLTSLRPHSDTTTILNRGDHPSKAAQRGFIWKAQGCAAALGINQTK